MTKKEYQKLLEENNDYNSTNNKKLWYKKRKKKNMRTAFDSDSEKDDITVKGKPKQRKHKYANSSYSKIEDSEE